MARIEVKPGRARLNLKIWTSTMSTDMTGAHMSEAAALAIYKIAMSGDPAGAVPEGFKLVPILPEVPTA